MAAGRAGQAGFRDGRRDFDFLNGVWHVRHRRLRRRLAGADDWDTFDGTCAALPILGDVGSLDDNLLHLPGGSYRAVTIRVFDPASQLWSIWWLDARRMVMDAPVQGRFDGGTGVFHADDVLDGRPIRVRFTWSDITRQTARWSQAFSADGGDSWETNWVMEFRRAR